MNNYYFFNRDLSWLAFNERVLSEAADARKPLVERLKFLSIFSSNLDEFYRVRMPALMALGKIGRSKRKAEDERPENTASFEEAKKVIAGQQQFFGSILTDQLIPALKAAGYTLIYNEPLPAFVKSELTNYFFNNIAAFIQVVFPDRRRNFFPENNKLYLVVSVSQRDAAPVLALINIPSESVGRFYTMKSDGTTRIFFLDDIVKDNLPFIFPGYSIHACYSIKITRDAELDLLDEYEDDLAEKIEKQISKRDFGMATRFLYQPGISPTVLQELISRFNLYDANIVPGGNYHNLKDLFDIPVHDPLLQQPPAQPLQLPLAPAADSIFADMMTRDILIHTPYHSYDTVLRFFNEAAIDPSVEEIYTTLYRVASDSRIVHALISAARNGKLVTVVVELKARFDEANNIKWAKRMKAAGVKIVYSVPKLKVHAKVALIKKKQNERLVYLGLFATGNLNENTALFYTDHILLTADGRLLRELELLFIFLRHRKKAGEEPAILFKHLLVAPFNLQQGFLSLIDQEIHLAAKGLPASVTVKLNNLEETVLISKLYEASNAGVKVNLIIRSVCCLVPAVSAMSANISVRRIVDRYLEHGRVFIFHNNGNERVFLGSADWMNRNIYHRVEVCFPIYDARLKQQVKDMLDLQLQDNQAAVNINAAMVNQQIFTDAPAIRSQERIYEYLKARLLHSGK